MAYGTTMFLTEWEASSPGLGTQAIGTIGSVR